MPAAIPIILGLGVAAQVGGTIASIDASNKAAAATEKASKKQEDAQNKLLAQAQERSRLDAVEATLAQKRAAQRSAQTQAGSAYKGGTDLISKNAAVNSGSFNPYSLLGSTYGAKTVLGA